MKYSGIVFYSPVFDMSGYGNVARNFLKSLNLTGLPILVVPHGYQDIREIGTETYNWIKSFCSTTNLGDQILLIKHGDPSVFQTKFNGGNIVKEVGMTCFETDRIPLEWVDFCNNCVDEVWIPSHFNFWTFQQSGVHKEKLRIVPYPIDTKIFYPDRPYREYEYLRGDNRLKFVYSSGYDYRKGYDLLIKAYCEEFSSQDNVLLLLKVYIPEWSKNIDAIGELHSYIPSKNDLPEFFIVNSKMSTEQLIDLYQSSDIFISTERANGWGMPEMECMALKKPVISINWGGSMEYMNDMNSFLIPSYNGLEPVDQRLQNARPAYQGHMWAKVRVEDVRKQMRLAYENAEERTRRAHNAALEIHKNYSCEAIGQKLKEMFGGE